MYILQILHLWGRYNQNASQNAEINNSHMANLILLFTQKPFKVLSAILNKQLLHLFENVPQAALLIQCFLDPDSLTEKPECSEDVCDDSDGIQQKRDDLYSLFTLQQQKTQSM